MLSRFLLIRRRLESSFDTKPILIHSELRCVLAALAAGVAPPSSSMDIAPPITATEQLSRQHFRPPSAQLSGNGHDNEVERGRRQPLINRTSSPVRHTHSEPLALRRGNVASCSCGCCCRWLWPRIDRCVDKSPSHAYSVLESFLATPLLGASDSTRSSDDPTVRAVPTLTTTGARDVGHGRSSSQHGRQPTTTRKCRTAER